MGVGREEEKNCIDSQDYTTWQKKYHSGQGQNSRPITPNWHAPQVPTCQ